MLEVDRQERYSRLLIFVKGILAIPHYFVLFFLGIGAFFAMIVAFFAVLFTGKYPRGVFDYLLGVIRWNQRVTGYTFLMTDAYPPFSLADDQGHSVRVSVEYPERIANWRPLVHWILVIPYYLVGAILAFIWFFVVVIAWFAILFTGRYPQGLFDFSLVTQRWYLRTAAYWLFMTERYPPWTWA